MAIEMLVASQAEIDGTGLFQPAASISAPLILAAVLLISGLAKGKDAASTTSVIRELRLPAAFQREWFAKLLTIGEISLALLLFSPASELFLAASIASLLLFATYWAVIARAMTFDPRPQCGCFGRIGDHRISAKTLVRNTILLALAVTSVMMAAQGETTASILQQNPETWGWLVSSALTAFLAALIAARPAQPLAPQPLQQPAASTSPTIGEADNGEPVGASRPLIPSAILQSADGHLHTLRELALQRPQLLIAVDCLCNPTHVVIRELDDWKKRLPRVDVRVMTTMLPEVLKAATNVQDPLYDHGGNAWKALGMRGSPSAALLGADGMMVTESVSDLKEIEILIDEIEAALWNENSPPTPEVTKDLKKGSNPPR